MTGSEDRRTNSTTTQPSPQEVILGMALGYLASRALHVATELGIADLLKDGSRNIEELASATGAHQQSLYRLLRTLAGHGVFAEEAPGRFHLTPAAAVLQARVPGSVHDAVRMIGDMTGDGAWWTVVGHLRHSVMTGEPGWDYVQKTSFFDYLAQHPEAGTWFDRGLANFTTVENVAIASCYDFGQCRWVVDVGGGQGGFLAEVLKAFPKVTGVLCDRPQVIQEPAYLTAAGLMDRCELVGIDFFKSVPGSGMSTSSSAFSTTGTIAVSAHGLETDKGYSYTIGAFHCGRRAGAVGWAKTKRYPPLRAAPPNKGLQPTAYSVRFSVAPASSGG